MKYEWIKRIAKISDNHMSITGDNFNQKIEPILYGGCRNY